MKNKGFTLIELLAVIVILAVIALITIPMINNVIENAKIGAIKASAEGLLQAANYYTIDNDSFYEFIFDDEKRGETTTGEKLNYKGSIEGNGTLYLDKDGDVSLCLMSDKYYVYKNYDSDIEVGKVEENNCNIEYDEQKNKYVALLNIGTSQVKNYYTKQEVDNIIANIQEQINNSNNISNEQLYFGEMTELYSEYYSSQIDKTVNLIDNWENYKFLVFSACDNGNASWDNLLNVPTVMISQWYNSYKASHLGTYPQFVARTNNSTATIFIPNGEKTFRVITSSGTSGTFKIIGIK